MYACNGILFNHESPRRGETFVTRKITRGLSNIAQGLEPCLYMGNIDALRDWGHAKDYVRMQWMMLQQDEARGFRHRHRGSVFGARIHHLDRDANWASTLEFSGEGVDEIATVTAISGRQCPGAQGWRCGDAGRSAVFPPGRG